MRGRPVWLVLGLLVLGLIALLVAWPLAELIVVGVGQLDVFARGSSRVRSAATNSAIIGFAVAALSAFIGAAGAFLTERTELRGAKWARLGLLMPILVPPFVGALSWMRAYGPGGLTDDLFGWQLPALQGLPGIVLVIAVNASPLAFLLTAAALRTRVETDLERAARVSGSSARSTLRTVTIPLIMPAISGVMALAFVVGINSFGVPAVLGSPSGVRTVTTLIYEDFALSARPESFGRAVLLAASLAVAAVLAIVLAERALRATGGAKAKSSIAASGPAIQRRRSAPVASAAIWAFVVLTSGIPMVALTLVALTRGVGLAPVPSNWTLAHFADAIDGRLLAGLGRSFLLAILAATVGVALGAAVTALRGRRLGGWYGPAVLVTFAIPGSTLAVAMLLAYGSWLRDTLLLILMAYVAKLWAVGHRAIAGSADSIPSELYLAARLSGASPVLAGRDVLWPLLRPAITGGWLLIFVIAFHELTMSSLLYGPGTETLAVSILNLQQLGDVPVSSALAVILTLPMFFVAIPVLSPPNLPRRIVGTG